ncbi:metal ABC transporter ATP-binding protein [Schaalia suimastitidis]|uniref:metal ABC transporter ATP-binding protein n=1 Tax=Schaalia suimastitidis TaxID=121163 RepID=UPI0004279DA2|nr:metal ABC transporter ATP-binding protein [Schaalia suimastitidis]
MTRDQPKAPPQDKMPGGATPRQDTKNIPAITVNHLSVHYGTVCALNDVTFCVDAGKVCALVGVNGSGKSTLLRAILGLTPSSAGHIEIFGNAARDARKNRHIAYVAQGDDIDLTFPLTVDDIVRSGCKSRHERRLSAWRTRHNKRGGDDAVEDALAQVNLCDMRLRQIGALSGGQRKRAFIARALAGKAPLILLDEPFAGVDHASEHMIRTLISDLVAHGSTVLVATHDLAHLSEFADEAILLAGRILAQGRPDEVCTPTVLARVFGIDTAARRDDAGQN